MTLPPNHQLRPLADLLDAGKALEPLAELGVERLAKLLETAAQVVFDGPDGDLAQHVLRTLIDSFVKRVE